MEDKKYKDIQKYINESFYDKTPPVSHLPDDGLAPTVERALCCDGLARRAQPSALARSPIQHLLQNSLLAIVESGEIHMREKRQRGQNKFVRN